MIVRSSLAGVLAVILVGGGAAAQSGGTSPLHGALAAGPHAVGFRILTVHDATRPQLPALRPDGTPETGDRARRLEVHLWYPARTAGGTPLTVADYVVAGVPADDAAEHEARQVRLRQFLGQFGPVSDEAWSDLLRTPLLARADASAAAGRFPLILGELRPFSTTVTNEHLASHGYVVAMVEAVSPVTPDPGAGLESAVRDMEFVIPVLRSEPFVDPVRLATLGFSGAGFSQILLAMRHPDVMAVCDLESAIFDDRMMWPLHRGWGYDIGALRVPFLHTYSVPLSALETRISDFEGMRYSLRYHYLVDAPAIHHWDFATEGMAASAVLRNRGDNGARLQQAFETTNRYVRAFYDAHVKGDATSLEFLRRAPEANGVPAGLITMRVLPRTEPAMTVAELHGAILRDGVAPALRAFEAGRQRDPHGATTGDEADLNRLAYVLLREERPAEAVAVFRKIVEMYPASANAYDSLSEALEAQGEHAEALGIARRGLEVLAREDLPPTRRDQLRQLMEDRVRRLGGG